MSYYDYGYDYGYGSSSGLDSMLGGMIVFGLIFLLIGLGFLVFSIIATWKVYKKAGYGGWEAIVPFYCNWILVKAGGLNWWWFLFLVAPIILSFIPVINGLSSLVMWFGFFNCYYNLAKKFNKGTGFAICMTLFTPICMAILAFSKNAVFNNGVAVSNNGVFPATAGNNGQQNMNNNYQQNMNNNYQQNNMNQMNNSNVNPAPAQPFSFCGGCGTKLENGVKFCPNCGKENN